MKFLLYVYLITSHLQIGGSHDLPHQACNLDNSILESYYSFRGYLHDMSSNKHGIAQLHGDTTTTLRRTYVIINQSGFITTPNMIISNGPWTIDFTIRLHSIQKKQFVLSNWVQQKWTFITIVDEGGFLIFKVRQASMDKIMVEAISNISLVEEQWTRIQIIWNPYARMSLMYFDNVEVSRAFVSDDILVLTLPISYEPFMWGVGDEVGKNVGLLNADLRNFYFYRSVKRCQDFKTELISFTKPTTQSSTYISNNQNYSSSLANDGIKNENDCSKTRKNLNPYWQIDLEDDISIAYIDIYLNKDQLVFGQKYELFSKTSLEKDWKVISRFSVRYGRTLYRVAPHRDMIGRFVKIMLVGVGELVLCEVEVYGMPYQDMNECSLSKELCPSNATCINTIGSYSCMCDQGYQFVGQRCVDINECSLLTPQPCSELVQCHNTVGSFSCGPCPDGYSGDGKICRDECLEKSCPNHSFCVNTNLGAQCRCTVGSYLGNSTCVFSNRHALRVSSFYLASFYHPTYSNMFSKKFVELAMTLEKTVLQVFRKENISLSGIQVTNISKLSVIQLDIELLIFTSQDFYTDIKRTLSSGSGDEMFKALRVGRKYKDVLKVENTDACKFRPGRCKEHGECLPKANFQFECKCGRDRVAGDGMTCLNDVVERGIIVASPIVAVIGILVVCICVFRLRQKFWKPEPVGKFSRRNYDNKAYEDDDLEKRRASAFRVAPPPSLTSFAEEEYEGNGNYDTFDGGKLRYRIDDLRIQRHSVYDMRRISRLEERQKRHSAYEMSRPRRK